jgi:hypothetical protein
MLSTRFLTKSKASKYVRLFCTASKYSGDSIPGVLKEVRKNNEWIDVARFHSQDENWTVKEFDNHTAAFAYGLVERGFVPGDKLMLWIDAEHSAEVAVAQIGALKAGVSITTVDAKDDMHHVGEALEHSGAKGLLISPHTKNDGKQQRANILLELIPELSEHFPGQSLSIDNFPNLSNIMHTGHSTIRGTIKFKESLLYTNPRYSNLKIPGASGDNLAFEFYEKGDLKTSMTNAELLKESKDVWNKYLKGGDSTYPVFLTLSLTTPLGFVTFISSITNGRKVFVPGTYNMAKITKSFGFQRSDTLVCDKEVYNFEAPQYRADEVEESKSNFKKVLVSDSVTDYSFNVYNES